MSDPKLWYKDAIIYELPIRAFYDSTADGIGDIPGLIQKLDYLEYLGINCLWLLPFFESPLKDDGYDIANFTAILPERGTMSDFEQLVREAHKRSIKILIELVLNHTSDQHVWFQEARRDRKSPKRDYYVWSDDPKRYKDARIIFTDFEASNWTWDEVAGQYYWHRFFSHQPDLNYDNAEVRQAMKDVLKFWLEKGVDGFRLDAVPYLFERDGTNCENLPQTHEYLKELRLFIDTEYAGKIFLAEANQWPDDVRPYFGNGDECHMAFHFPVMPRIFMSIRKEDRTPIVDIIRRTPEIPAECQWALFLRNHDELTLEMVTKEERDYMWTEYAADDKARRNLGIIHRLAPLMNNGRRQMELLNSLLFSLPGTPVIYYGDEIGMGDDLKQKDRSGVRTPMQWSSAPNAGFSNAASDELYLPVISDPVYGYQAVNVEAQKTYKTSFLNWMRRLIQVRKAHRAFGRGAVQFLDPVNIKILVYLRRFEQEVLLVVNNLSRYVQPVELDLCFLQGYVPYEMIGGTRFPAIGELPYFLTLGPHAFYWFRLEKQ
ncbi:MAG: maltose alpha-D-glucosyltransferase [Candidatus Omnitrophica bacterium]|jgi:maltose alpha-D-glucosyltransferase/alpha-amylase|nr:maltose alpha-D-glucosyltransferase [Candidatus Omnitrophota bacterium]